MRFAVIALLACGFASRADEKNELKKLEGVWEYVDGEAGGQKIPAGKGAPDKLTIKDGKLTGFGPELTLVIDASKKPKWLNMTFTRDGKETTINAIYELTGDELKISLPLAPKKGSGAVFENKRPVNFETKDKPEMVLKLKKSN